jgi:hypothetical protein
MSPVPSPRVTAPGQGKTVKLFAVRFDYKVTAEHLGGVGQGPEDRPAEQHRAGFAASPMP